MPHPSPPPDHSTFLVWNSPTEKWYWICRGCGHVAKKELGYEAASRQAAAHDAKDQAKAKKAA